MLIFLEDTIYVTRTKIKHLLPVQYSTLYVYTKSDLISMIKKSIQILTDLLFSNLTEKYIDVLSCSDFVQIKYNSNN